jgi:putative phosphoribosyl transferase
MVTGIPARWGRVVAPAVGAMRFADRADAGRHLARRLFHLDRCDAAVVGLARCGIPVAVTIAHALALPVDVVVARRLVDPHQPGLTVGAVAEHSVTMLRPAVPGFAGLHPDELEKAGREVRAQARALRRGRPPLSLAGRTVVVADDGAVTGMTAAAGVRAVRALRPDRVVLALAVAPAAVVSTLSLEADEVVCVETPPEVITLESWYADFALPTAAEIAVLLRAVRA